MNNCKKICILLIIVLILLFSIFTYLSYVIERKIKIESKYAQQILFKEKEFMYELEFVRNDLATYGYSRRFTDIVITNIKEASIKYKIPVGLLHAIFRIESDYRFNITHPTVSVNYKGKQISTNAIGMGGIIWIFWRDSLISKGIAENEMDLYLPDVNIKASAYILRILINDELKKKGREGFTLSSVISRYYGEYSGLYLSKMEKITSDLWLKRIAKEVVSVGIHSLTRICK